MSKHDKRDLTPEKMDPFTATMIAEGNWDMVGIDPDEDPDRAEELFIAANQKLIDTGMAWSLQGSFGRQARRLIDAGYCHA